jgi:hypothetical protein
MKHRRTIVLLDFYYHQLPVLLESAKEELAAIQSDRQQIAWEKTGVASYQVQEARGAGAHGDPVLSAVGDILRGSQDERKLQREISEYETIQRHVTAALRLVRSDMRLALEKLFRDGMNQSNLPLTVHISSFNYHYDYAMSKISVYLRDHVRGESLHFCAMNYPELFDEHARNFRRIRGPLLVQC